MTGSAAAAALGWLCELECTQGEAMVVKFYFMMPSLSFMEYWAFHSSSNGQGIQSAFHADSAASHPFIPNHNENVSFLQLGI